MSMNLPEGLLEQLLRDKSTLLVSNGSNIERSRVTELSPSGRHVRFSSGDMLFSHWLPVSRVWTRELYDAHCEASPRGACIAQPDLIIEEIWPVKVEEEASS